MYTDSTVLYLTAASIGFFHTLLGPDHYIPFIVISKARKWSMWKTNLITFLCGIGHVGSSILIGFIGILFTHLFIYHSFQIVIAKCPIQTTI